MERKRFNPDKGELERLFGFMSCQKVGEHYGVCAEVVRRKLHEYGIKVTKRSFDPQREVLEQLYQEMSMRDIAKHFNVGETVVWNRLKEHGIQLKDHVNHRLKTGRQFSEEHLANLRKSRRENRRIGETSNGWKGGLTEKHRKLRQSVEYKDWRKEALELRGNKCQECGVYDGSVCGCCGEKVKLHVHHVKSFAKFPESRFDPENSEVLCPKCHHDRHRLKIG